MSIVVDGVKRNVGPVNIEQAVAHELDMIFTHNRHVKSFRVNGVDEDYTNFSALHNGSTDLVVEIETCTLDELIESTMQSSFEVLPSMHGLLKDCVYAARTGDEQLLAELQGKVIPLVSWHAEILTGLAKLGPRPSFVHDMAGKIVGLLPQLTDAIQNQDVITFADIVEYEMIPWAEEWYAGVDMFRSQMNIEKLKQNFH